MATSVEVVENSQARSRLVEGIKVQSGRTTVKQLPAQSRDDFGAVIRNGLSVITIGFELLANPAWNLGTTSIGETCQLGVIGNRHNTWHNRHFDTQRPHSFDKIEVRISVEEILCNGEIRSRFHLAYEILQVLLKVRRLGVRLGIGRHGDLEMVTGLSANKLHQLIGIAQLTNTAHARRLVAA